MKFEVHGLVIVAAALTIGCTTIPTEAQLRSAAEHSAETLENSAAIASFSREGLRGADELQRSFRLGSEADTTLLRDQIPASSQSAFSASQAFYASSAAGGVRKIWVSRTLAISPEGHRLSIETLKVEFSPPGCPTESTLQSALSAQPHFTGVTDVSDRVSFDVHGDQNSAASVDLPLGSCTVFVSRTAVLA